MNIFSNKTVIVTGAGASKEYGYPLGNELRLQVTSILASGPFRALLKKQKYEDAFVDEFLELLKYSTSHETIDSLLEHHPRFRNIGCLAIAYILLSQGHHGTIFPAKGWYRRLFTELSLDTDTSPARNISFVTLNYEQSLQYYLQHSYKYDCSEAKYADAKRNIESIKHLYAHGTLGTFPRTPLSNNDKDAIAIAVAQSMMLIFDNVDETDPFRKAADEIAQAQNVVFLGLGYEMRTMRRLLGKYANDTTKNFFGTVFKLPAARRNELRKLFGGNIILFDCSIEQWFDRMLFIDAEFPNDTAEFISFDRHDNNKILITNKHSGHNVLLDRPSINHVLSGEYSQLIKKYSANPEDAKTLRSISIRTLVNVAYKIDEQP
jgi:hypothetical protein